ncbi:GNAT family N-acetyltransferase [Arsenicicoccus dermatophilus]|uniref:GNAT family N-acetyltransferase n=1 Tax=Arsenicicoccus dermatophilus TaxID=1076331 RepID=UPI003916D4CF
MSLDRQPTLTGPTLRLRPLTDADREALYAVAGDPLIWEQHPSDRYRRVEFDEFFDDALRSGGALVVETLDGDVIGTSRFHVPGAPGPLEIGWTFLARSHWGGSTNQELKRLMLDHAFGAVGRVHFSVAPHNYRSRRAVEKLGATCLPDLRPDGHVVYELRRSDWHAV